MYGADVRAMPVLGVCLTWGMLQTVACAWSPPTGNIEKKEPATVTEGEPLSLVRAQPGGRIREGFPVPVSESEQGYQFTLKGAAGLGFQLDGAHENFVLTINGTLTPADGPNTKAFFWIHVDTSVTPGDTLSIDYTLAPAGDPKRITHWQRKVVALDRSGENNGRIALLPALRPNFPNPCKPATTIPSTCGRKLRSRCASLMPADGRWSRSWTSGARQVVTKSTGTEPTRREGRLRAASTSCTFAPAAQWKRGRWFS